MNIIVDTNVIINILRAKKTTTVLKFINPNKNQLYISIVSEAETRSIALRNKWGRSRKDKLDDLLEYFRIVEVSQPRIDIYTQIDAYSQRLNPNFTDYPFATPRNMGKNDLWITSVAALLGLKLITTDSDFDHLHEVFFEVQKLQAADFVPFF